MANLYGPRIVTDGLIFHVDAGNRKSYPGSGTTWFDLSGNGSNGTLTNGPTFNSNNGGSIVFDRINDEVIFGNSASLQITVGTIAAFFKATNLNTSVHGLIAKQSAWGLFVWGNVLRAYDWGNGTVRSSSATVGNNQWYYAAMTFTQTVGTPSNNAIIYLDGNAILTTTIKHSNHNVTLQIGDANANQQFGGNVAQASVYNRVLSVAEIKENYNALKGRFGK
jgi:hypothetical protein